MVKKDFKFVKSIVKYANFINSSNTIEVGRLNYLFYRSTIDIFEILQISGAIYIIGLVVSIKH